MPQPPMPHPFTDHSLFRCLDVSYLLHCPDYVNNTVLTIPCHLGHAPYNLFAASVSSTTSVSLFGIAHNDAHEIDIDVYTHQLLSNPDQPGTAHFHSNLSHTHDCYCDCSVCCCVSSHPQKASQLYMILTYCISSSLQY